ncbi:MAG TPA: hypothetical protein VGG99_14610 [Acetobacteraceae bacterium]|jgi:hypothetical protein
MGQTRNSELGALELGALGLGALGLGALGLVALGVLGALAARGPRASGSNARAATSTPRPAASSWPGLSLPSTHGRSCVDGRVKPGHDGGTPSVKAARRLNTAAGLLATSVLADSAVEHYRGSFNNRAMYTPLVTAALTLAISGHGVGDKRPGAHILRDITYLLAGLTGLAGTGFHFYNVGKRPGGFSWLNLFYGSPLGAPFALLLSGVLGFTAERVRENKPGVTPRIFGLPAGRAMAALTALGMLGTVGEAGLLHFRGAYQNPAMFLPITVPPIASGLLANVAMGSRDTNRWFTRWWLRLTALLGLAGVGFHTYGVSRAMGGWRNWSQNVLDGPPLPAPPSFTGLALAGLAALGLLRDHPDA